jgi:hypothetical protein
MVWHRQKGKDSMRQEQGGNGMKKIVEGIAIYLVFVFHPKTLVGLARARLEIEKMTQEMAETNRRLLEAIRQTNCAMESMRRPAKLPEEILWEEAVKNQPIVQGEGRQ